MYRHLEDFANRRAEKVARFLSLEMLLGVVLTTTPVYLITTNTPPVLRALAVVLAVVLGLVVTADLGGLPLYARALWIVRGRIRTLTTGTLVLPATFAQDVTLTRAARPLRRNSPVQPLLHSSAHVNGRPGAVTGQRVAQRASARGPQPTLAAGRSAARVLVSEEAARVSG